MENLCFLFFKSSYGPELPIKRLSNPIFTSVIKWAKIPKINWRAVILCNDNNATHNFANIVSANATAVGCYSADCGDRASAACVFSQPRAPIGTVVYMFGNPCRHGGKCSNAKTGRCELGLCVNTA
ncbi:hypothetical protein KIN20_016612 [Parelaphostrongylus tenuis]|uniref:SCP domain-containing protein n=1 Tax=Parelaphostrongylus tenuis TaxID=148309 RepID=A0AAD5MLV1_PARTN|nr:hypothetical protein KIN20_016612 [Parelaphostrongylus tenuis]